MQFPLTFSQCQNLSECKKWLNHGKAEGDHDDDARYAAKYLEREYYVS